MPKTLLRLACGTFALLLLAGAAMERAGAAEPRLRTWKARSGSYTLAATFLGYEGGVVKLLKPDRSIVSVGLESLSDADQAYVREHVGLPPKPAAEPLAEPAQTPAKPASGSPSAELEEKRQQLCDQITKGYKAAQPGAKPTVAVVEFSDLSGSVTDLGRLLSEELITKLFSTGNYKVIERLLLNKVISEHKLQLQGMVDPKSAKELGRILGVDAIVSGTIADLGATLRVNARVISTESGEILSGAAATIVKDDAVAKLTGGTTRPAGPADPDPSVARKDQPVTLPFREDFSSYKDDETPPGWGRGVKVRTGADGRKWLVAATKGQHPVGRDVDLPDSAYIEFDYGVELLEGRPAAAPIPDGMRAKDKVLSGITLVDEAGAKYRIEWSISKIYSSFVHHLTLSGGADVGIDLQPADGTVRIQKTGDTITVVIGGKKLTGNTRDFKRFTRFEVDAYRGPNASISFTNFRIGKLQ